MTPMVRRTTVMAAFFVVSCTLVQADWQYTQWGMTSDEVIKASGGAATPIPAEEKRKYRNPQPSLSAPYKVASYSFTAFFYFDSKNGGLNRVRLQLVDSTFDQGLSFRDAVLQKYGKPDKEEGSPGAKSYFVHWWRPDAYVVFGYSSSTLGESYNISYSSLHWAENDGL